MTISFDQFGYTFGIAVGAWLCAIVVALCVATVLYVTRVSRGFVVGVWSFFGLLPFLLMPGILAFIDQPKVSVWGKDIFPLEILLIIFACVFPLIEATYAEIRLSERRYSHLARMAGLSALRELKRLALPYLITSLLTAACAALPSAILLSVVFEWARGGRMGIGALTQGIVEAGSLFDRAELVVLVGGLTLIIYAAVRQLRRRLQVNYGLISNEKMVVAGNDLSHRDTSRERGWTWGIGIGIAIYVLIWSMWFSSSNLDETMKMTPLRFVEMLKTRLLAAPTALDVSLPQAGLATLHTVEYAFGAALVGTMTAVLAAVFAHSNRVLRIVLDAIASVTQSVPIFVLIPLYLLVLRERAAVAILVAVSVTFFQGYELLRARLELAAEGWGDLLTLARNKNSAVAAMRALRYWHIPILTQYGLAVFVLTWPLAVISALVADLFLGIGGLAHMSVYEGRSDIFVSVLAINISLVLMLFAYSAARVAAQRMRL